MRESIETPLSAQDPTFSPRAAAISSDGCRTSTLVVQKRLDERPIAREWVDAHFLGTVINGSDFRHAMLIPASETCRQEVPSSSV
jgi:hypothetical protein